MLTTIDHIVSLLSSTAIGTAVVLLSVYRIPKMERWTQISRARWILVGSFTLLVISGFFKIDEEQADLISTVTLCVASYQALLFSYTASVMLTRSISSRTIVWTLVLITLFTCLLFVAKLSMLALFPYLWYFAAIAYCVQIVIHTILFRKRYRETTAELEDYYDDDVNFHLRPIKKLFYSALFIGVLAALAALLPFNHWGYNSFVVVYTLYYIYVAVAIMNYCFDADFFLAPAEDLAGKSSQQDDVLLPPMSHKAIFGEDAPELIVPMFESLEKALDEWVKSKGFTKMDVSTDQVAAQLHVTRQQLASYFTMVYNTTFRSWRQQLRLEYARILFHDNPDISLAHIHEMVGFNDRSNFHTAFRKLTGVTPQEYRERIKGLTTDSTPTGLSPDPSPEQPHPQPLPKGGGE